MPSHPWQKDRIDTEKRLKRDYGFKNKKEIWKMNSRLKGMQAQAKRLAAARGKQAEKETEQLLVRLQRLGLLTGENATLDAVLGLQVENVLDRRLQSVVTKLGLAHTMKQARQFITHRHITVNGVPVTFPSKLVTVEEENNIGFLERSPLVNDMHPERLNKDQIMEIQKQKEAAAAAAAKEAEKPAEEKTVEEAAEAKEAPKEEAPAEKPAEAAPETPTEAPKEEVKEAPAEAPKETKEEAPEAPKE